MKYLFILLAGFTIASCGTSDKQTPTVTSEKEVVAPAATIDSTNVTTIEWIDPVALDLGSITKGQVVELSC